MSSPPEKFLYKMRFDPYALERYKNYIIVAMVVALTALIVMNVRSCNEAGLSKKEIKEIKKENERLDKEAKRLDAVVVGLERARKQEQEEAARQLEEARKTENKANESKHETEKIKKQTNADLESIRRAHPDSNIRLFPIDAEDYLNNRER